MREGNAAEPAAQAPRDMAQRFAYCATACPRRLWRAAGSAVSRCQSAVTPQCAAGFKGTGVRALSSSFR